MPHQWLALAEPLLGKEVLQVTAKEQVRQLLETLRDDSSLEEIQQAIEDLYADEDLLTEEQRAELDRRIEEHERNPGAGKVYANAGDFINELRSELKNRSQVPQVSEGPR